MQYRITRSPRLLGLALLALPAAAAILFAAAGAPRSVGAAVPHAVTTSAPEVWRLGVVSEGSSAYDSVIGRLVGAAAGFRSNRGVTDIYYLFPAPARARTVRSAALYIADRTGAYTSTTSLTLEVRGYDGSLRQTITAAPIDLQSAPAGVWSELALAADPAALAIAPGEYLAFRFRLDGAPAGDLDIHPVFEVALTSNPATATATPTATSTTMPTATSTATATATPTTQPTPRKLYLPEVRR